MAPTPKVYASEIAELAGILDAHIVTVHDLARRVTEKGLEELPTEQQILELMHFSAAVLDLAKAMLYQRALRSP